ncbi:LysM peptidoglycan-binding domain-containing protein [Histomonas meleagridis]|uniref:LysM peptidoglycan-binding domain-containing protein n=1 Tax=Histomonas meleagridis TaxID=135588 RepID=UPI003559D1E4|nr:LysM peptidoglycan-binding domain-containing protein [Histomonas meleagridis]KAH0805978.1 LysM peptidoglycan-binding domain-containing protein [Histomonas meleagridis]
MFNLLLSAIYSLNLSTYCQSNNPATEVSIDVLDIPFSQCSIQNFQGYVINTTYEAVINYPSQFRTLRVDDGLTLNIFDVISADILQTIDIATGYVHIYPREGVSEIIGSIRINEEDGGHLFIHGSFKAEKKKMIRIIHTNDIHCSLSESSAKEYIGFSKAITYVKNEKQKAQEEGYEVLFLDAGDFISGYPNCNLGKGHFGITAINQAKYDALTIGNHFWDFGYEEAKANYEYLDSSIPLLVANVQDSYATNPFQFTQYITRVINGAKIGLFGLATPYTPQTTKKESVETLYFDPDIVNISQNIVKILREEEKCDIIILISHLGYKQLDITSNALAESFNGIDVIVDGHSHTEIFNGAFHLNNDYQTLIVQTGAYLKHVGIADILIDESNRVVGKKAKLLSFDDFVDVEPDPEMEQLLKENEKALEPITAVVVGETQIDLPQNIDELKMLGTSKLGKLLVSSILKKSEKEANVAMINAGTVRAPLTKGEIKYGNLLEILPFGNLLTYCEVKGTQLKDIIKFGTRGYKKEQISGFPYFAGITFTIDLSKGQDDEGRITNLKLVDVDGNYIADVDDDLYYVLALPDFLYSGGDGYDMIPNYKLLENGNPMIDYLEEFIKELSPIKGNEKFFEVQTISDIGNFVLQHQKRIIKDPYPSEKVVVVNGIFNGVNDRFAQEKFYDYSLSSKGILGPSLDYLRLYANESLGYFGGNGIYYATSVEDMMFGKEINNDPVNLSKITKCNGMFMKIDSNMECQVNTNAVILAASFGVLIFVALVVIIVVSIIKSKTGSHPGYSDISRV